MTTGGWCFLILSWTGILALFAYSLALTLRRSGSYIDPDDEA